MMKLSLFYLFILYQLCSVAISSPAQGTEEEPQHECVSNATFNESAARIKAALIEIYDKLVELDGSGK